MSYILFNNASLQQKVTISKLPSAPQDQTSQQH